MSHDNIYLTTPMAPLFTKTATPIVVIMLVNGLFTVVDAYFLGQYVSAAAVIAVTLMFPFYMLITALSTLVSSGFSSIYARQIGASDPQHNVTFSSAIQLSLVVCVTLIAGFAIFGWSVSIWMTRADTALATMGHTYMAILIYAAPLGFILALFGDALRAEGQLAIMAAIALGSALLNIAFDYILIVPLQMGVAGSAIATVLSQVCALVAVLVWRGKHGRSTSLKWRVSPHQWCEILALGAPLSLGFIGISLTAGLTLFALQTWVPETFTTLSGAYGIMNRVFTLIYLPLLGLAMALQTIVGNNAGADHPERVQAALRLALTVSFAYGVIVQLALWCTAPHLGAVFVNDIAISNAIARVTPISTSALFLMGPLMMVARYFQAIGDVKRAAILSLAKTYAFVPVLILGLPVFIGEWGIWLAGPTAEWLMFATSVFVFRNVSQNRSK